MTLNKSRTVSFAHPLLEIRGKELTVTKEQKAVWSADKVERS